MFDADRGHLGNLHTPKAEVLLCSCPFYLGAFGATRALKLVEYQYIWNFCAQHDAPQGQQGQRLHEGGVLQGVKV